MSKLKISPDLSLPTDAVTSTIVVYGGKGMGKTNLASVLVEEFAGAALRFVVIDPMGVWWGLRHGADGKGAGIEVLILGGIHADLPIEPTAGAIVADLVVDEDISVILDISRRSDGSMWSIGERVRFMTDFAKRLYQRQGEKRSPINLVIDEAARFAPQVVRAGDMDVAKCMGAVAVLVEEGRNVGIGVTLITQRSARLNKDVAELADCMIAFRIVGPNSMRAVLDWLGEHVDKARLKEIGEQLRSLPRGTALVVSPGWLEFEGIAAMRKRKTFDSSATPKAGQQLRASGPGFKPDLAKYRARMAEVVERATQNDPKALKARVAELEKQLAAKPGAKTETKTVEKAVIKDSQLKHIETLLARGEKLCDRTDAQVHELETWRALLAEDLNQLRAVAAIAKQSVANIPARPTAATSRPAPRIAAPLTNRRENVSRNIPAEGALPVGEAAVLRALIQFPDGLRREQLTVLTGYKRSTRDAYIQRLKEKGFVDINLVYVFATDAGRAAMPDAEPLPTGEALQQWWLPRLPTGEAAILKQLIDVYPGAASRDDLTESTGYQRSTRDAYLQRLGAKQLVMDLGRGSVKAADTLFEVTR